jgi:hypothetical protein
MLREVFQQAHDQYAGDMKNGTYHGRGVCVKPNKNKYEGEWADGTPHGYGKAEWVTIDSRYEGEWKNGLRHGLGEYTQSSGNIFTYKGMYAADRMHGQGVMKRSDGYCYEGNFFQGDKQGHGKETCSEHVYVGSFTADQRHGHGKIQWTDETVYEGEFQHGVIHGRGEMKKTDGFRYQGTWVGGEPHGKGKSTYPDANVYDGEWVQGCQHGRGQYTYANGDVFQGAFKNDMRHGSGTVSKTNGEQIVGVWKNDNLEGNVILFHTDGSRSKLKYTNGKPVDENHYVFSAMRNGIVRHVHCKVSDDGQAMIDASLQAAAAAAASVPSGTSSSAQSVEAPSHTTSKQPASLAAYESMCIECTKPVDTRKKHRVVQCKRGTSTFHTHCLSAQCLDELREHKKCPGKHKTGQACTLLIARAQEMRSSSSVLRTLL